MRARWALVVVIIALLDPARSATTAGADDERDASAARAAEVAAAAADPSPERLRALAAEPDPDPWLVVDALQASSRHEAAEKFGAAYAGPDAGALRKFASTRPTPDRRTRARLEAAEAHFAREALVQAAAEVASDADPSDPIAQVLVAELRSVIAGATDEGPQAAAAAAAAAAFASKLGWTRRIVANERNAGALFASAGRTQRASEAWTRLRDVQRAIGDDVGEALTAADLGVLAGNLGEDVRAVELFRYALRSKALAGDENALAAIRIRLGRSLTRLADYAAAHAELRQAEARLAADAASPSYAEVCSALGVYHRAIGDPEASLDWTRRSRDVYASDRAREERGERAWRSDLARADGNLAVVAYEQGRYDDAWRLYEQAELMLRAAGDLRGAARCVQGRAEVCLRREEWEKAAALARAAVKELGPREDPEGLLAAQATAAEAQLGIGTSASALSEVERIRSECLDRGYFAMALEYTTLLARGRADAKDLTGAAAACTLGLDYLEGQYGPLGADDRMAARRRFAPLFDIAVEVTHRAGDLEGLFRFVEAGRAAGLLDALVNRAVLASRGVPEALDSERLAAERDINDAIRARDDAGLAGGDLRPARAALVRALNRHRAAVRSIQETSRSTAHVIYPRPITLQAALSLLREDEAAVEFAVVGHDVVALVLQRSGIQVVPIGSSTAASDASATSLLNTDKDAGHRLETARRVLWDPVAKRLSPSARRIFVSPAGRIGLSPFRVLAEGATAGLRFSFIPSVTTLSVLRGLGPRAGEGTLSLGVADLPGAAPSPLAPGPTGDRLQEAEDEAREVGSVALIGGLATEEAFDRALGTRRRWSAVHFACHGLPNLTRPVLSWLALARGPERDGYLMALEIFQRDVPADVAVLAACHSGAGVPVPGEGLDGIVRALMFSGCPRVVANLWRANDAASRVFSREFHRRWSAGADLSTAVEAATAATKAQHPTPRHWAGWCTWGDI